MFTWLLSWRSDGRFSITYYYFCYLVPSKHAFHRYPYPQLQPFLHIFLDFCLIYLWALSRSSIAFRTFGVSRSLIVYGLFPRSLHIFYPQFCAVILVRIWKCTGNVKKRPRNAKELRKRAETKRTQEEESKPPSSAIHFKVRWLCFFVKQFWFSKGTTTDKFSNDLCVKSIHFAYGFRSLSFLPVSRCFIVLES